MVAVVVNMTPAFREKGLFNNKSNEKNVRQATTTTVLGKTQANLFRYANEKPISVFWQHAILEHTEWP